MSVHEHINNLIWESYQEENKTILDRVKDAANTQRKIPEGVMMDVTRNYITIPIVQSILEHLGDLSHRAQKIDALYNVHEKINLKSYLPSIMGNPRRLSLENEIKNGLKIEAIHDYFGSKGMKVDYSKRLIDFPQDEKDEIYKIIYKKSKIAIEGLEKYINAHETHNKPITKGGKLGKEIAILAAEYIKSVYDNSPLHGDKEKLAELRIKISEMRVWLSDIIKIKNEKSEDEFIRSFIE